MTNPVNTNEKQFTFSGDLDITEEDAKHWCSMYSLRFLRFEGKSVIVKWDSPKDITVAELLGRARMLDLILTGDFNWKLLR